VLSRRSPRPVACPQHHVMGRGLGQKGWCGMATEQPLELLHGDFPPYTVKFTLRGLRPFLFNALLDYAEEDPGEQKQPRKPPKDYESMVWRNGGDTLALPTQHVIASIAHAGRFFKSPIATRGSAKTTLQEAMVDGDEFSDFGVASWDAIDFRIARYAGKSRAPKPTWRPRLEKGWSLSGTFSVILPELYSPTRILEVLTHAGRVCGVGDGRKLGMGRFAPDGFQIEEGLSW
jgi:hypothetical protein